MLDASACCHDAVAYLKGETARLDCWLYHTCLPSPFTLILLFWVDMNEMP
jgi:hypothetical protein